MTCIALLWIMSEFNSAPTSRANPLCWIVGPRFNLAKTLVFQRHPHKLCDGIQLTHCLNKWEI